MRVVAGTQTLSNAKCEIKMTQRSYHLYQYKIPVDSQLILRNRFLKVREGLLVKIQCGEKIGWGEIAPLPEYSQETLDEARNQCLQWLEDWQKDQQSSNLDDLFPSVAWGLSCAKSEMIGDLPPVNTFPTAPLCYGDPDELYEKLDQMPGQKVGKVKVGLYEANRDGMICDMLLEALPDLSLRLDANRSWTMAKAQSFAKYVKKAHRSRIQFLEEPCKTREESLQFAEMSGIRIAWDESVREKNFKLVQDDRVSAIVIKPTLVGSLQKCVKLIQQAQAFDMLAVVSSSIESSFGLTQLASFAQRYTPNTPAGLDTLDLMSCQVVRAWQGSDLPLVSLENNEFIQLVAQS